MKRKMTSDYCSDHCVFTIYQKTLKIQSILRFDLVTSICRVRYSVTFLKSLHLLDNSHRAEWVLCMWSGNLPTCTFSQFLGSPPSLPGRRSFSSSHNPPQLTWKKERVTKLNPLRITHLLAHVIRMILTRIARRWRHTNACSSCCNSFLL